MSRSEKRRLTGWVRRNWARMDEATQREVTEAVAQWERMDHAWRHYIEVLPTNWAGWKLLTPIYMAMVPVADAARAVARDRLEKLKKRVCVRPPDGQDRCTQCLRVAPCWLSYIGRAPYCRDCDGPEKGGWR